MEKIDWFFDSLVQAVNRTSPSNELTRLKKTFIAPSSTSIKKLEKDFNKYLKKNRNWIRTFTIEKTDENWYEFTVTIGETIKYVDKPVYVALEHDVDVIFDILRWVQSSNISIENQKNFLQFNLANYLANYKLIEE